MKIKKLVEKSEFLCDGCLNGEVVYVIVGEHNNMCLCTDCFESLIIQVEIKKIQEGYNTRNIRNA